MLGRSCPIPEVARVMSPRATFRRKWAGVEMRMPHCEWPVKRGNTIFRPYFWMVTRSPILASCQKYLAVDRGRRMQP